MPNWVHNHVVLQGDRTALDAIESALKGDKSPISFDRLIPMPSEAEDDWYNWSVTHWGTKWDACHAVSKREDGALSYTFDTAWAPPMPFMEKLAKTCKNVDIDYSYNEEQGWGGTMEIRQGQLVKHDQYDIPSSHVEMIERQGWCWCDDETPAFEDCFPQRAAEMTDVAPETVEAAKALGSGWHGSFDDLVAAASRL